MLHKAIKLSLAYAVRINYIRFNCCDGVIPPKIKINEENDFKVFSLEEQKKFMEIINNHKYRLMFIVALH